MEKWGILAGLVAGSFVAGIVFMAICAWITAIHNLTFKRIVKAVWLVYLLNIPAVVVFLGVPADMGQPALIKFLAVVGLVFLGTFFGIYWGFQTFSGRTFLAAVMFIALTGGFWFGARYALPQMGVEFPGQARE